MVADDGRPGSTGDRQGLRTAGPLLTAGIQMAVAVGLVGFGGYLLDRSLGTTPWMLLAGILAGAGAGMVLFVKTVNEVNKSEQEESRR